MDAVVLSSDYGYDRTDMDRLRDIDRYCVYCTHVYCTSIHVCTTCTVCTVRIRIHTYICMCCVFAYSVHMYVRIRVQ